MSDPSQTLVELLRVRASLQGDRTLYTFLVDGERADASLTYADLDRQATVIAAHLQTTSNPGDRALLLYPPGLDFIAAFFGCLYAGVIAVPAYPPRKNQSMARLQAIVTDAEAALVLTTDALLETIERRFAADLEGAGMRVIATDGVPVAIVDRWQAPDLTANTLAFLQYTSGSTGDPKGVMVSHGNVLHNSAYIQQACQLTSDSVSVTWLPSYHDMGLIDGVIQPLYSGFLGVLMPPVSFLQRPLRWLAAISHYRATHSGGPNFAYDLCVRKIPPAQRQSLDLSSWQSAYNGAEPVRRTTLEQFAAAFQPCGFHPRSFYPCYGMAEATLMVTGGLLSAEPVYCAVDAAALTQHQAIAATGGAQAVSYWVGCGRSQFDIAVVIADPQTLTRCQPHAVGEIWVAGASVARGYWQRPEQTAHTFQAYLAETGEGPFLRTGDLGFLRDGELFVTGRLKDLIILRGRNHYPQEIELTAASAHPALRVESAAAFTVERDGAEHLVVACEVERTALRTLDPDAVIAVIRRAVIEQHELNIDAVLLLKPASIPKTSSGKIQRYLTRSGFLAGTLDVVAQWHPATLSHHTLACDPPHAPQIGSADIQAWLIRHIAQQQNLSPTAIDPQESFAYCGLDSVAAVSLLADLEDWLGYPLLPTLAYDYPTIAALAAHLGQTPGPEASQSVRPLRTASGGGEAIAIIGLDCRFPGADSPDAFWHLLSNGIDAVTAAPAHRQPVRAGETHPIWAGWLDVVDRFDPQFFHISPREAERMDPQQRLLLEVSWHALEDAGLAPDLLAGSSSGVFIGISTHDYAHLQFGRGEPDGYASTGNALSIAANRLSYQLDWRGPSWAVDTACSSSLVAVHQACQSLRSGECDLALAGGVNLILTPYLTLALSQGRFLAADGRCKTFDASANGYVRGEGCAVVVLKRESDAVRDGDNILALIRGSAANQDGRSNGLTAPRGVAQQAVIRQALANGGVLPAEISYVEAHGTGTALGDPIEVNAIQTVLADGRSAEQPCAIGSVKTNIGHLEAAAGMAGLIKTVLALQHKAIPATLHQNQLNPKIAIANTPFSIPHTLQPWTAQRRFAGVSSFGFGGTNAHVVLAEAPIVKSAEERVVSSSPALLAISAKCESALQALARRYVAFLDSEPNVSLQDICHTTQVGRSQFKHRLGLIASSSAQMSQQLRAWMAEPAPTRDRLSGVAFLFTGQGSQFIGMGRELYENQPVFRQALDRCAAILHPELDEPLLDVLYPNTALEPRHTIDSTAYAQPALFALEYALCALWQSWGIRPSISIGHSVGEYVAACIAGVFSLEDGLKLIAARGRLMQALPEGGAMAAVLADLAQVSCAIAPLPDLSISAINAPTQIVISGAAASVAQAITALEAVGVKTKLLQVSHAFHSPLMQPMLGEFEQVARQVTYTPPTSEVCLISSVTGQTIAGEIGTSEYWVNHVTQPVRFAEGMATLNRLGRFACLEIGPQPTLLRLGRQCLPESGQVWLASLDPHVPDRLQMFGSLAALYEWGFSVDWEGFHGGALHRRVKLPRYPFERSRFWFEPQSASSTEPSSIKIQNPTAICHLLQPHLAELANPSELTAYGAALAELDTLSLAYGVQAFQQLGWTLQVGDHRSLSHLKQWGVVEEYRPLALRLLNMLTEVGFLHRSGNQWEVVRSPDFPPPSVHLQRLQTQYPEVIAELTLLARCGAELAAVLRGARDPLELLFPQGDLAAARQLYRDSPGARVMNDLVQKVVSAAMGDASPNAPVRILEIGAGTGGTTAYLLPHLAAKCTQYVFTDVGTGFIAKAQETFRDFPFVTYRVLNIERDPQVQGWANQQYDIVVAANVLHATQDLRQTLQHVHQLLTPGGLFVLLEGTAPRYWLDLVFGLTPGWWRFSDRAVRPFYPLLPLDEWQVLLSESGFTDLAPLAPDPDAIGPAFQQTLILAQASVIAPQPSFAPSAPIPVAEPLRQPLQPSPPQNLLQQVRNLVATVLGIENPQSIHPQHGFSELGMDSLTAMDLKEKLQAQFNCVLYSTVVLDHPTLASLAQYLEQHIGVIASPSPKPDAAIVPTDPPAPESPPETSPEPSLDEIADLLAEKLASLQQENAP